MCRFVCRFLHFNYLACHYLFFTNYLYQQAAVVQHRQVLCVKGYGPLCRDQIFSLIFVRLAFHYYTPLSSIVAFNLKMQDVGTVLVNIYLDKQHS